MPNQILWIAAFALVCGIAGASVLHALGASPWLGFIVGLVPGSAPAWVAWMHTLRGSSSATAFNPSRAGEQTALILLTIIAATIALTGLFPVLELVDVPLRIESNLSMLLIAPVLYGAYLILSRTGLAARQVTVSDRLAGALSGPPLTLSLMMAVTLATGTVLAIHYAGLKVPAWEFVASKFTQRGIIPPLTLMLFFWGLLLLANKAWVLSHERRQLAADGAKSTLAQAHAEAVGNGEITIDGFVEMVWRKSADFYVVPRYLNWAIPILGFIGTVLGISLAADGIQNIIGSGRGLSDLSGELGEAIAPLGIAFDTTLIALSLSVVLTFLQIGLQRREDNFLGDYENWVRNGASTSTKSSHPDIEAAGPPGP